MVVMVDDADTVDDADGTVASVLTRRRHDLHVVAAGRADVLRTLYGHWTQTVRRSKLGILLKPNADLDGDLLGTMLPRRETVPARPGRGYLVSNGEARLVQVAQPTARPRAATSRRR